MRRTRKVGAAGMAGAVGLIIMSAAVWACIAGPTLDLASRDVRPGEAVTLKGVSYNRHPVVVRFNALDGPVLGTIEPTGGSATSSNWNLEGSVTIPAGARPGSYVLIATQPGPDGKLTQIPTRALVNVVGTSTPVLGGTPDAAQAARPAGLDRGDSVSGAAKALMALGVAGVALFIGGTAALIASRPKGAREAAKA